MNDKLQCLTRVKMNRAVTSGTTDTRQRLIEVAVDLFTRHSFAGMAGAAGSTWVNLGFEALHEHLVDAGRRTLGLRVPRRSA